MIPQYQQIMHDPDNGKYGDCFRACIASLLEKPIEEVPHFMQYAEGDDGEGLRALCEWLKPMKYGFVAYNAVSSEDSLHSWQDYFLLKLNKDTHHIISAYTARGTFHSVIGRGGHVVFDPHPSGVGLLQPSEDNPWMFEHIVLL